MNGTGAFHEHYAQSRSTDSALPKARVGTSVALVGTLSPQHSTSDVRSDDELVIGIAARDSESLDLLHSRYASFVVSAASRIGCDRSLAQDVAQDVFIQVWGQATRYDSARGSVRAWLTVIARTRALDQLRARRVRAVRSAPIDVAADARAGGQGHSPEAWLFAREASAQIDRALSILSPADRRLIDLAYFKGLTQREIAIALAQPLGTVKTRTRRSIALLRAVITGPAGRRSDAATAA